jgi:glycine/D-amino acid oxidase-like deaminating enzyme
VACGLPNLDRRSLIRTAGIAGGAMIVSGCAGTALRGASPPNCLPRVDADPQAVIRTLVGLRPYRESGFVVRAEQLGSSRIVHNYGHGGAGITLSWGTSKLATELGLPSHSGPVAVIGAGIIGLSTARLVQEAGFPVTVYAAALPPDTTSNLAGGQWHPFGHFRAQAVTAEWRRQFLAAAEYSWRRFQIMVGDDYGVRWLPTYYETDGDIEAALLPTFPPNNRMLAVHEHPFALDHVARFDTLYVETGRYLRQLTADLERAGATLVVRRFDRPAELAALPERLVFNCTGLGSRALFNDLELRPASGQLVVLVPQPEVRYAFTGRAGYMFPRSDGIILGGTFDLDDWSTTPRPETTDRILRAHQRLFAGFRC